MASNSKGICKGKQCSFKIFCSDYIDEGMELAQMQLQMQLHSKKKQEMALKMKKL
jgi:hypothetical protein